ncbi:hypothetical protein ASG47_08160 [Devosia sp. Leaf420]|uniref:hypothetical protein n=1 Tax=Devosia sp. Leaf420 TaxID=1736374 RepID=UPI000712EEEF|nr:hypothetical protein [Devosia sp. Leaf420]KQT48317.1 hypothetical protein ASG47_08160 [Devosia sp. Leaf420]
MSEIQPPRFPWLRYILVLIVILLIALGPVISVIISSSVASANGCNLNEGGVNVCMVGGTDMGDMLYTMFVMGWFGLLTLPLGFGAVIVWIVIVTTHRIAWGRHQKGIQP